MPHYSFTSVTPLDRISSGKSARHPAGVLQIQTDVIDRSIDRAFIHQPSVFGEGGPGKSLGAEEAVVTQCALADWLASMGPRLLPSFLLPFSSAT